MPGVSRAYGMVNRMPPAVVSGDTSLLAGETDGLAIDFTSSTYFDTSTWGQLWNQKRVSSVDTYSSPHVFYTQSGTSPKVVKTSATGLGWSPHNLLLQSQTLGTTWTLSGSHGVLTSDVTAAPDGTSTAEFFKSDIGSFAYALVQSSIAGTVAGLTYAFSVYAKPNGWNWIELVFADSGGFSHYVTQSFNISTGALGTARGPGGAYTIVGTPTATSVGNGWYRCTVVINTATAAPTLVQLEIGSSDAFSGVFTGDNVSGAYFWGAQINRGYSATAYIATTSAAVNGLPISYGEGLLVEPAGTNLVLQSETFGTTWAATSCSVTSNTTAAPDGATTADTMTSSAGGGTAGRVIQTGLTFTGSTVYTLSIYAKQGTDRYLQIIIAGGGQSDGANFDLQAGTMQFFGGGTLGSITLIGNGWYRCVYTFTEFAGTSNAIEWADVSGLSATRRESNNLSGTIFLWGAQIEASSVATSYIPTLGSTVTRARDDVQVLVSAFPFSATVGTMIVFPTSINGPDGINGVPWYLDDTTSNERQGIYRSAANTYHAEVIDGGSGQVDITTGLTGLTDGTAFKVAFAWTANDFAACANGGTVGTDASGTLPTVTTLRFGTNHGSTTTRYLIARAVYVPRRMTNGELQTKTT